jgi:AAA+ ATPase superfamily predicted ATPase
MPGEFLDREDELAALEEQWAGEGARYFVLWGRRRVGKTELLNRYAYGKRAFFFEATDTTELSQLRALSAELAAASSNVLLAAQPVSSWEAALAAIEQFASGERTVVVLDEFQFLAQRQAGPGDVAEHLVAHDRQPAAAGVHHRGQRSVVLS